MVQQKCVEMKLICLLLSCSLLCSPGTISPAAHFTRPMHFSFTTLSQDIFTFFSEKILKHWKLTSVAYLPVQTHFIACYRHLNPFAPIVQAHMFYNYNNISHHLSFTYAYTKRMGKELKIPASKHGIFLNN